MCRVLVRKNLTLRVVRVPLLDTGLGREAGFRDDAHMIEVAKAEREVMNQDPLSKGILERMDRAEDEAFLFGSDA